MRSRWFVALVALSACGVGAPSGQPLPASTAPSASANPAEAEGEPDSKAVLEAPVPVPPEGPWRDDVEREHWAEAWQKLEGLPASAKARPEMRFLRARVAAGLGRDADAITALAGLEPLLPALARAIGRLRAEAQGRVGPYDQAAAYWAAQRGGAREVLLAARAYEKAQRPDEARRALDRAVASAKGADEIDARAMRSRLADAAGAHETALADARWLVRSAPGTPADIDAQALLRRYDPSFEFSARERAARAERLSELGRHEGALVELDTIEPKPGGVGVGELAHLRGAALFKARRYPEAIDAIKKALAAGAPAAGDDEYLLARALSRADRDEEALAAYRALAKKFAKSGRADDALYAVGRLLFLMGRDEEADNAYGEYLRRFPKGKSRNDARYERALAQLGAGRAAAARASFGQLAAAAEAGEAARLRELEAVAAADAGDLKAAERLFRDVIRTHPLTWAASVARARLLSLGLTPPLHLEPAPVVPEPPPLAVQLPGPAELLRRLGLYSDAEEFLSRNEAAFRSAHAPRGVEALCQAYGSLERGQRRLQVSYEAIRADTLTRAPSAATRWAWDCLYPSPFGAVIRDVTARDRLPAELIYAIMRQESGFRPKVVSPVGAIGLLQLMPYTARSLSAKTNTVLEEGSLERPAVNVDLGSRYMANLLGIWKGSIPLMVASYNAGPHAVSRWVARWGTLPVDVWAARIPYAETRQYVSRVMGNLARYTFMTGGEAAVLPVPLVLDATLRAPDDAF
ncbi:MAG: transglycosylase SLT domain-containing protein [Polyangiaceae bacterium]|nr:transglycosylase SLT domain-containing protein [Polyangiaceae bacterium]